MKPWILSFLLFFPIALFADTFRCSNCNQDVTRLYALRGLTGEKKMICANCYARTPHCGICSMPVKKGEYQQLGDGRIVCNDDFKVGIFSQQDAAEIVRETRRELERTFYRFNMEFPETNVTVTLVAADRLYALAHESYNPRYPEICGYTKPIVHDENGKELTDLSALDGNKEPPHVTYQMYLASGLPRARLMAVCAHEYGHVWHTSNLALDRTLQLEAKTREAFCELVAYQLMGAMNQPFEQAVIEANLYTRGQSGLLIEVEKGYGFNRILQWMKRGKDLHISSENLDRVRMLDFDPNGSTAGEPLFVNAPPIKIPETLLLKGILGSGNKKLALINNQTFSPTEIAKVKVGNTNVSVQVMEIRKDSVLVRTNGSIETTEIFLQK